MFGSWYRTALLRCIDGRAVVMMRQLASVDDGSPALCQGHAKFTEAATLHAFAVQGELIVLRHDPEVFPPSSFGLRFAELVDFRDCRRAADIGTGTGLLAILAAKKGVPDVRATDVSASAVELADHNARRVNHVAGVETHHGGFFCELTGTFDVITANLPQEIIPPDYHAALSQLQAQAIDGGGAGGNEVLLEFLDIAHAYMHEKSKLYIIINTITDYRRTLRRIGEAFDVALVWEGLTSAKHFVRENIGFFRPLMDAGVIHLVEDDSGNWHARQFIYRLALRSGGQSAMTSC